MKLKTLLLSALIGLSLVACNDDKDYSGVYTYTLPKYQSKLTITIEKGKNGDYQLTFSDIISTDSLTGFVKNGVFYSASNNEKVGEFKENQFILKNGTQYNKN